MRAISIANGLLVLSLVGAIQPASASLISKDLITAGDGLITLDTSTNLEWLDLTETLGQSYNTVVGGYGGYATTYGFHYANETQVSGLFTNAGLADGVSNAANFSPAQSLIGLVGCTSDCSSTDGYAAAGALDFDPASGIWAGLGSVDVILNDGTAYATSYNSAHLKSESVHNGIGNWLVRDAVSTIPVPATLPLMASGLGLAGFIGWRRKRRDGRPQMLTTSRPRGPNRVFSAPVSARYST